MNSALRSPSSRLLVKRLLGGQTPIFVRNAGGPGHAPVPGGGIPFPPGPKQMQQMKNWASAAAIFGATGFTAMVYFTDWRVICD